MRKIIALFSHQGKSIFSVTEKDHGDCRSSWCNPCKAPEKEESIHRLHEVWSGPRTKVRSTKQHPFEDEIVFCRFKVRSMDLPFDLYRGVRYHEPEYWKFGEEGNRYFRHATGQLYAISKDLASYILNNQ